jgi:PAS domain S-box-containing protein
MQTFRLHPRIQAVQCAVPADAGGAHRPSASSPAEHPVVHTPDASALLDQLPLGIVHTDVGGRVTWCNRAFEKICGWPLASLMGRSPGAMLQGTGTSRQTVREIRDAVRRYRPISADIVNYHRDGTMYWAHLSIAPVRAADGLLTGYIAACEDVTERQQRASRLAALAADLAAEPHLTGTVTQCAWSKRLLDPASGEWIETTEFLHRNTAARVSHGLSDLRFAEPPVPE